MAATVHSVSIPTARVLAATGGALVRGDAVAEFSGVGIDTRAVAPGSLFVAVKGDRFDGHDFAEGAVAAGAQGVLVARGRGGHIGAGVVIEVDDPVQALGAIGRAQRQALPALRVVAITGSHGKTTTKEMVAAILAAAVGPEAVLKTEGNLNNHLGVPLTLGRLHGGHRYAVVEMGMSGLGEIAYLTELARPDVAVIVSIAGVHLEQLQTIENVARAKAEIFGGLGAGGIAVYPAAEPLLTPHLAGLSPAQRRTFGPADVIDADVRYDHVRVGPTGVELRLYSDDNVSVLNVPLIGRHNASNAAAAAAVARALGIDHKPIVDGLARVRPAKHRAQLVPLGGRTLLDDCYNAAPPSTRAAIDALVEITPLSGQKIAVLGDMLELGPDSERLHAEIGAYAAERVDHLITIGPQSAAMHAAAAALGDRRLHTDDPEAAAARVSAISRAGDVVLVKASRGMRLERVIEALAALWAPSEAQ
jgi:UDP-N-acetylmuramoyl-tripeptide--D-alanyl-D-alanine ligase